MYALHNIHDLFYFLLTESMFIGEASLLGRLKENRLKIEFLSVGQLSYYI